MNKKILTLVAGILILLVAHSAHSVPALDEPFTLSQPDGSSFTARLGGDEWFNWHSVSDKLIIPDAQGYWNYGQIVSGKLRPSGARVGIHAIPPGVATHRDLPALGALRRAERAAALDETGLDSTSTQPLAAAPSEPTEPLLVLLVSFADEDIVYSDSTWANTFFGTTGSTVRAYYEEVSKGSFHFAPAPETYGTVNDGIVSVDLGYAHPNTGQDIDERNQNIVKDALVAANGFVNFSQFDSNGNGRLSANELHILTVVAGYEKSYGTAPTPNVWGHRWSLFGSVIPPILDGKTVCSAAYGGGYTQFGETHYNHQATIGIICHELGHDLGLPDLYDTDTTNGTSRGVGTFCLMGHGSWCMKSGEQSGQTPVHLSAWCKVELGFVEPTVATSGNHYLTAAPSPAYNVVKFPTGRPDEYFLVENRQRDGFDAGFYRYFSQYSGDGSGGGVAIWHIDDGQTSNGDENHKWVDIEEANEQTVGVKQLDTEANYGRKAHLFYSGGNTHFGDTTTPNSKYYDLASSNADIGGISASGSVMSLYVCLGDSPGPPVASITPDIGGNGGGLSIAGITGGPFDSGAQVKLAKSGEVDIPAANVVVTSGSISCDFNLLGAAPGRWNVVVTNPCTQPGVLTGGFTVAAAGSGRFYTANLDSNPGWTTSGQWAFGQPTGGGGSPYPYPDPVSGYTGSNVFGINLNGNYSTSVGSAQYLTSQAINCAGLTQTELRYWCWLNCDASTKVRQTVDVSDNGSTWTNLWTNPSSVITGGEWSQSAHPISAIADGSAGVQLRWGHQIVGGGAKAYSGWNIDDIEVWGIPETSTVGAAKNKNHLTAAGLTGVTTTTATSTYPGEFYVQDASHSGLRVQTNGVVQANRLVDMVGRIAQTPSGDCYFDAVYVTDRGSATPAVPHTMSTQSVGGAAAGLQHGVTDGRGANNVGLLVRVCGRAQSINSTSFYLDDGSSEMLKVLIPSGLPAPANGAHVAVTGISWRENSGGDWIPVVKARGPGYFQTLKNP